MKTSILVIFGIFCVAQLSACGNVEGNGCYYGDRYCGSQEVVDPVDAQPQPPVEKTPPKITLNPAPTTVSFAPSSTIAFENTNMAHASIIDNDPVSQADDKGNNIIVSPYYSAQAKPYQEPGQIISAPYASATYTPDN